MQIFLIKKKTQDMKMSDNGIKWSRIVFIGRSKEIFTKNVTCLLHSMTVGVGIKWQEVAEIGQTIGLGSDDF